MAEDSIGKKMFDELALEIGPAWDRLGAQRLQNIFSFCEGYKSFLTGAKTEREANHLILAESQKGGFLPASKTDAVRPGDRLYFDNRGRSSALVVIGEKPISEGFRLVGSHIDSPRLDLKTRPLYEEDGLALLKTQYYGGIKKYQWPTQPLALHGVVVLANGQQIEMCLGEGPDDPVFCVTDLLPHLANSQMDKKAKDVVAGESLNIVVGNLPFPDDPDFKERVKLNTLRLLCDTYGIIEEDLISADLTAVPAGSARDVGFDRSLIGAYGQDDRVCAYSSLLAFMELTRPEYTAICLFTDREEVGSMGNTGARSRFLENVVAELVFRQAGVANADRTLRRALCHAEALSADVTAAFDPSFPEVSDKRNSSRLGYGINLTKYTGGRGKGGASEASAEFLGRIRLLLNSHDIPWQPGDLGKVDEGGGGTIAQFLADLGMEVLDAGVPVLSMHSPFELASKVDVYSSYRAYKVFWQPER